MKNRQLFEVRNAIQRANNLKGAKFAFILSKNNRKINGYIEDLQSAIKPSEKYDEFERKRIELCESYGEKDLTINQYKIDPAKQSEFDEKYKELDSEYKEAIEEHQKKVDDYNALLDEEAEIELKKIKFDDLPKDISVEVLDGLYLMVEDND